MLLLVPAFFVGGLLLARTKDTIADDITAVWKAAAARAADAAARAEGHAPLLTVRELDVGYSGVQVLFGIDLEVAEGECVALLGTNGAGKSTLLRAISGIVEADRGVVLLDGREITHAPPNEIAALGVAQVPGGSGVFPTLTVAENLRMAGWLCGRDRGEVDRRIARAHELFPVLADRSGIAAGDLSGGQQQMLGLAMALVGTPSLLLIDELSLGLAPTIVAELLELVRDVLAAGTTVVLVEQSVNVALQVADSAIFLEKGEVRFRGPTSDLLNRPDVLRSVFLEGASAGFASGPRENGDRVAATGAADGDAVGADAVPVPVLETVGVTVSFGGIRAVDRVDLEVSAGEIVGIIGPNGAGKTTLFDLVSGFLRADDGRVLLGGADVTRMSPARRSRHGLGRSFQDGRLFPAMTVTEALGVACERFVTNRDPVSAALRMPWVYDAERAVSARVDELLELLGLGAFRQTFVRELSTGTRRILDLACLLAHRPSVVLLDEPSSGIAQREAEALAPLLRRIRDATGAALVVVEHDMPLVRAVADRLVAMDQGAVVAVGPPDLVLHHPAVVAAYLGTNDAVIERSVSS
jgi:branched-chain amino acid transport system ATP-binding protein